MRLKNISLLKIYMYIYVYSTVGETYKSDILRVIHKYVQRIKVQRIDTENIEFHNVQSRSRALPAETSARSDRTDSRIPRQVAADVNRSWDGRTGLRGT